MGKRKEFIGTVTSDKMHKTVVVKVVRSGKHPKYHRVEKYTKKFKAHDEGSTAKMGDVVRIEETRPLSKDKHFRVVAVVKKAAGAQLQVKEEVT